MTAKPTVAESIKETSRKLRGDISGELADANPYVSNASYELLKFHGSYQGYDRDTATARKKQGLEKEWEFMLRLKMPAGRLTAAQYLALDSLCDTFANGTLRITTRQTFQYHNILKPSLKPLVRGICEELLCTLGGCGDVVRNVVTSPAPFKTPPYEKLLEDTYAIARHMTPQTDSYAEIWLDGEDITDTFEDGRLNWLPPKVTAREPDPLYGATYMPRKFKIGLTLPEDNSIDVLTNDVAILALWEGETLHGYNICLGGGMGVTHNKPETYPRLASPVVFVEPDDLIRVTEAVVKLQRDYGDRTNRKHARLKYVVEERGPEWTRKTLEEYAGKPLTDPRPMPAFAVPDHMGWHAQGDGRWFLGIPISSGRIVDRGEERIRSGLRAVIERYEMPVSLTPDQNLILYDIAENDRDAITGILKEHGIKLREDISSVYRDFLACVALPTCGKALAEAERVKLPLVEELERLMEKYGVAADKIAIRMTGCPHGCARPYVGDIGIVGRTPGHYALFIGGDYACTRLNEKVFDRIPFEHLVTALEPMVALYAAERAGTAEGFGDFCHRYGIERVKRRVLDACAGEHKWAA